jgi:hypothetical protein
MSGGSHIDLNWLMRNDSSVLCNEIVRLRNENDELIKQNKSLKIFMSVHMIARTIVESSKLMLRTEGQDQTELKKYLHHLIAQYNEATDEQRNPFVRQPMDHDCLQD